jgi:hypothetical protein
VFPGYSLPDPTGMVRTLSGLQGRDPLILLLVRGNYCPKEHHQHPEFAANYPKVAVACTRIVTISTTITLPRSSGPQSAPNGPSSPIPLGPLPPETWFVIRRRSPIVALRGELTEGGAKAGSRHHGPLWLKTS